jgi:leucyl aminopeptidase (aminopeptidase T)
VLKLAVSASEIQQDLVCLACYNDKVARSCRGITMRWSVIGIMALLVAPLGMLPSAALQDKRGDGRSGQLAALASNVVHHSARVREGDLVQIQGSPKDLPLLEELAVQARKVGAHPLITLTSDRLARRLYDEVPAKFDSSSGRFDLAMARLVDVSLSVESLEDDALAGVPADRLVAVHKAAEAAADTLLKRNVRTVAIGNRLYPSAGRARQYGISEAELEKLFYDGLAADGKTLQASGAKVAKALQAGQRLHITGPGGTDMTFDIRKRQVLISDGVLTPEREKQGGAACLTWLPAGEVFLAPVPGSAEGTFTAPHVLWQGKPIRNLRLTFAKGRLTALKAESGAEGLEKVYAGHGKGKDLFGAIDLGINPNVAVPAGSQALTYIASGLVTLTLGGNTWAGGDNTINFAVDCHLPGCTATVDGKVILEKGKWKIP